MALCASLSISSLGSWTTVSDTQTFINLLPARKLHNGRNRTFHRRSIRAFLEHQAHAFRLQIRSKERVKEFEYWVTVLQARARNRGVCRCAQGMDGDMVGSIGNEMGDGKASDDVTVSSKGRRGRRKGKALESFSESDSDIDNEPGKRSGRRRKNKSVESAEGADPLQAEGSDVDVIKPKGRRRSQKSRSDADVDVGKENAVEAGSLEFEIGTTEQKDDGDLNATRRKTWKNKSKAQMEEPSAEQYKDEKQDGLVSSDHDLTSDLNDEEKDKDWPVEADTLSGDELEPEQTSTPRSKPRKELMSLEEKELRYMFLESLMDKSRSGDLAGCEEAISEMAIVGLKPGPHAYHGLVVAYTRAGDPEGALHALRRELQSGEKPLQETFTAMVRLFGMAGLSRKGEEMLAVMESADLYSRPAWLVLVEELYRAGHLKEATNGFLMGLKGGFQGTDFLYDLLVEENCKSGNHGAAVEILEQMEFKGRPSTTLHYNSLILAQGNAGFPEIAAETFENMQYSGREDLKPDTESYNLLIQAYTRNETDDRLEDVVSLLGEMVEDHKRVQPNARTYALLVECYTKYNHVKEALRHFRALTRIPGGLKVLQNEGRYGDPLALYLRSLCLEGRLMELVEALDAMIKENIPISPRAMLSRKGRTLVSSWIEPLQREADIGRDVDFVARFVAEGGLTGTRKRWIPSSGIDQSSCLPDYEGFRFGPPREKSYKQQCIFRRKMYYQKLIKMLKMEGVYGLWDGATEEDLNKVLEVLNRVTYEGGSGKTKKPKAASKMLVPELKEELEAQGLPIDGTRLVLYQRVKKARRINLVKGRPLWMPPLEDKVEVDEILEDVLSKVSLYNKRMEYRRKWFVGEETESLSGHLLKYEIRTLSDSESGSDEEDDVIEDDDAEGEEEEEEEKIETVDKLEEDDEVTDEVGIDIIEPSESLAAQEVKSSENEIVEQEESQVVGEQEKGEGTYVKMSIEEKREYLRKSRFDFSQLYTLADVWGWTWEKEIKYMVPDQWSRKSEVELAMQIMDKVIALGELPTIGDCAMLVRDSLKTPYPEATVSLLQRTHKIGYRFGSKLYHDAVTLYMSLGEKDAAVAILTDMEDAGISTSNDLLNQVLPEP